MQEPDSESDIKSDSEVDLDKDFDGSRFFEEMVNMIEHIHPADLKHEHDDGGWYIGDCVDTAGRERRLCMQMVRITPKV